MPEDRPADQLRVAKADRPYPAIGRRIVSGLLVVAVSLAVISFLGQIATRRLDSHAVKRLATWFDVDSESNVPTWCSTVLLAGASMLCCVVAGTRRIGQATSSRQWFVLSALMLFLSLDEGAAIHEKIGHLMEPLQFRGALYFAWVVPWSAFVVLVAAYFFRFLLKLPPSDRWNIIVAGATYVVGALGLEFVEGLLLTLRGEADLIYEAVATAQELMEMVGVVLFIGVLLRVLGRTVSIQSVCRAE